MQWLLVMGKCTLTGLVAAAILRIVPPEPAYTSATTAYILERVGWLQTKLERIEKKLGTTPAR